MGQTQTNNKRKSGNQTAATGSSVVTRIRYFDKDAISEHLHCPICQEVFNYPVALQCGHVFCNSCINQWLSHQQRTCPECRMVVDMRYSHRDLTAHKFLDSVMVYCSFLGCSWIGRMDSLQSHVSECECNPSKLPEYMVSKETVPAARETEEEEGTTSLRMKLFKGDKRDLLTSVASGSSNIFAVPAIEGRREEKIPRLSDLTNDLITSSDVISRNLPKAMSSSSDFIDLDDDGE